MTVLSALPLGRDTTGLQEDNDDNSNPDATAFERLCRAHIRAFAKGAERYKAETKLTKRVGDWQGKLAPILEEEQQRPEFDINRYSEKVIDRMTVTLSDRKRKITPDPKKVRRLQFCRARFCSVWRYVLFCSVLFCSIAHTYRCSFCCCHSLSVGLDCLRCV